MSDSTTHPERRYKFNTPPFDHAYYRDSVIPKSLSNWNNLPNHLRVISKLDTFKFMLKKEYLKPPNPMLHYHNLGNRPSQMSHTRIRVKFSNLNFHLFNYNLVTDPNCTHCNVPETPHHYFFICAIYAQARSHMMDKVKNDLQSANCTEKITMPLLLHGKKELSFGQNAKIFDAIHNFIRATGRNP